jgi:hypothetical protein
VRQGNLGLFFNSPQVPSPALSQCQPAGASACCSANYTAQIDARTDAVHQQIMSRFDNVPSACASLFDQLACVYCSPESSLFITSTPTSFDLMHICESYCNRFYTTCASAVIRGTGQTIAVAYANGKDFCAHDASWYSVWMLDVVSTASGSICYDPDITGACTTDDIVGEYTQCDPTYNTRNLIYHWKRRNDGTQCTPGAVQLPQSIFGLRCDISCGPGQYLPLGQTRCAPCMPGTYSVGGGVRIDDWGMGGSSWPSTQHVSFTTYSQDSVDKQPKGSAWVNHGSYIDSGNNTNVNDLESILELTVTLVRPGNLTFEAKVSTEANYDGFRLEIDNTRHELNDLAHQFKRITFSLTAGVHIVRWVYYKDYSWSTGEDRAFINMIQIEGLAYADDACQVCPAGTFAPGNGTAECMPCTTPGYIPFGNPPSNCAACPSGMTALPYDSECRTKRSCTTDDYEPRYSACRAPLPGTRDLTWEWTYPHICDDRLVSLPPPQNNIPCEPCNPGEKRGASAQCIYCPDGQRSDGNECTACPLGSVAIKSQIYTTFQFPGGGGGGSSSSNVAWPSGWSSGCDHCDTNGFRAHYDHLDSGDGEDLFNSWLELDLDFYSSGKIEVIATMDCPYYDCSIRIWLDGIITDMSFSGNSVDEIHNFTVPITNSGPHKISIDFTRWTPLFANHEHNNTRAKIHSITLVGVRPGGASSCTTCSAGSVPGLDRASCDICPAGKAPEGSICQSCPVNKVTLEPGSTECISCGAGTTTNGATGQQACKDNGCSFSAQLTSSWPVSFNISAIASPTNMYTVYTSSDRRVAYHFSMCTKASNSSCRATSGPALDSFACMKTWYGSYVDWGRLLNFVYDPPADPSEEKLVVQYTHGSVCNVRALSQMQDKREISQDNEHAARDHMLALYKRDGQAVNETRRITNITLICDPIAGIGTPQPHPDGIEHEPCALNFVWYSVYGCHICTENDYDWRYTSCESGFRSKVFFWKYNPKRCWGGVNLLPQTVIEPCSASQIVCPDGQQVSGKFDNCTACPAGNYSVSGGEVIQWWTPESMAHYAFVASCTTASGAVDSSCEDGWKPEGVDVASQGHMEGTSVLSTDRVFLHDGSISFDFTLLTENEEPFQFYIDNVLTKMWNHTTMQGSSIHKSNVRMGYHTFAWKFSPFVKEEKVRQVVLHSVTFRGLGISKPYCSACPAPLVALKEGSSSCTTCPLNTVYKNSAKCEPCPANQYALPGDTTCRTRMPCEQHDYFQVFGACANNKRSSEWRPAQPRICTGDVSGLGNRTVDCAACPAGQYRENAQGPCISCSAGYFFDFNGLQCKVAPRGTASVRMLEFFTGNDGTAVYHNPVMSKKRTLPDGWDTGCRGVCGTDGWRFLGDFMDSGLHFEQADSWVSYSTTLVTDGSISFLVNASSHYDIGPSVAAEFFIDNVPQPLHNLAAHQYTFPVSAGQHTFLWLHHQDQETLSGDIRTVVSTLKIQGTEDLGGYVAYDCPPGYSGAGGTVPCAICSPGTYTINRKSDQCIECPVGTFNSAPGSSVCTPCGAGTTPNKDKGATECVNTCTFSSGVTDTTTNIAGNYTFDLTALKQLGPIVVPSGQSQTFTLRVCDKLASTESSCKSSSAFVCETNADLHQSFEAGNLLSFYPQPAEPDSHAVASGFTLEYSMGSQVACPKTRKTFLHFACQMGAIPYVAKYDSSTRACEHHINISTQYACPLCNSFDLVKVILPPRAWLITNAS